jgi:hypothetical protein
MPPASRSISPPSTAPTAFLLTQHPLHDGRSEVVSASEDAHALALYKQDVEVLRRPVSLVPGEST